jgi:hypothetical protein
MASNLGVNYGRIPILSLLVTAFLGSAAASCDPTSPLSRKIEEFHARNAVIADALVQLGQENRICIGIEALHEDLLTRRVDFDSYQQSAAEIFRRILAQVPSLNLSETDGVVVIGSLPREPAHWLDFVVPRFVSSRNDLMFVDSTLKMTFAAAANPSIQTFVGSFPGGDPADLVGPFDEQRKTLRELLNRLILESNGALWVVYGPAESAPTPPKGGFWRILPYSLERSSILSLLRALDQTPKK